MNRQRNFNIPLLIKLKRHVDQAGQTYWQQFAIKQSCHEKKTHSTLVTFSGLKNEGTTASSGIRETITI